MASGPVPGSAGYGAVVERFAELTEAVDFRELHACIWHLLPGAGARILDAGAGTGRDAACFAELGGRVVAVEPTPEFLALARERYGGEVRWLAGSLPGLEVLGPDVEPFDFVMCHGVWQHLDDQERPRALARFAELMRPGALLALALRHGPAGAGTHYFPADTEQTLRWATEVGLVPVLRLDHRPSLLPNKRHVTWTRLAFRRPPT